MDSKKLIDLKKKYLNEIRKYYEKYDVDQMLQGDIATLTKFAIEHIIVRATSAIEKAELYELMGEKDGIILSSLNAHIDIIHKAEADLEKVVSNPDYWRD